MRTGRTATEVSLRSLCSRNPPLCVLQAAALSSAACCCPASACKTLESMRHVRVSFRELLVQRDQWDTYWGAKKIFFFIRDIDDAAMAGASVESCRWAAQKPSGSRFGSVLHMCNRLRRLRRRFQINIHLSALYLYWPWFAKDFDPELSEEHQAPPHAAEATTRPQTYPGGSPRADLHPKKVNNLGPMAPRSRKKRQFF